MNGKLKNRKKKTRWEIKYEIKKTEETILYWSFTKKSVNGIKSSLEKFTNYLKIIVFFLSTFFVDLVLKKYS